MNLDNGENSKYCSIQIDMDDNQWVLPRQRNQSYNVSNFDNFIKAMFNIRKCLEPYPVTLFLVGLDMNVKEKVAAINVLRKNQAGTEIANHSLSHCNNLCLLSNEEKKKEIVDSDSIIREALGVDRIFGFRSPGYIFENDLIEIIKNMGYLYDASLFPSYFGPILRNANYLLNGVPGKNNFGYFKNGFLPNEPFLLDSQKGFFELNVSVCPVLRTPIQYSVIRSEKIYRAMMPFLKRLKYLNFIFHLYDFLNIDAIKLKNILNLITFRRKIILGKDIDSFYKEEGRVNRCTTTF